LGLTKSPKQYFRIIKGVQKNWEWVNHYALKRAIKNLYRSKLLDAIDNPDETTTLILTELGKKHALTYKIDEITIPRMKKWDRKWRVVIFDIREDKRTKRDCIRKWLKNLGIIRLQESVYVHPFDFKRELNLMVGVLIVSDVKYMICDIIEGEDELIDHFISEDVLIEDDLRSKR